MAEVGLEELNKQIERILNVDAPQERRKLHEEIAKNTQQIVRNRIAATVNDSHGKIQNWQWRYVGTGGGYAAVRAADSSSGPNSPGAITNYLNSGTKRGIKARRFYESAEAQAFAEADAMAQAFADKLAAMIGGDG